MQPGIKKNIVGTLAFVGLVWVVYLINSMIMIPGSWFGTGWDLNKFGLHPRTASGLVGIFTMPFLHHTFRHLLANTVPLTVLLFMLVSTKTHPRRVLLCLTVLSGSMLWILGRATLHIGCSGLVYAIAAYLIAAGVYERQARSAVAAILVAVLYGSLIWGLFPFEAEFDSWEAHLLGAIAGGVFAHLTLRKRDGAGSSQPPAKTAL